MNLHIHNQSMSIVKNVCEFDVRPCRCVRDAIHVRWWLPVGRCLCLSTSISSINETYNHEAKWLCKCHHQKTLCKVL
jgi:hypothetical protein